MKKKIIFLIILMAPFVVSASSLSIECDSSIVKTDSFSCSVKGNSSSIITSISAKVSTASNIEFVSFSQSGSWKGDGEGGKIELYTASDEMSGNFDIGKITFKVNKLYDGGDSSFTVDQISFYDENGIEESIGTMNKSIRIASSNNDLLELSLNNVNINPVFNKNVTSYSAQTTASSIIISARKSNDRATINGDIGTKNLNYGNNTFRITVTSEADTSKVYTINVVRLNTKENKSSNNFLSNIKLNNGNINFEKNVLEYNINVLYDVDNIEVTAVPEDNKSKIEISGNENLNVGLNKIKILVIAEDGSEREYIINVDKKKEDEKLSNNTNIAKLKIKNYDIDFNKNKLNYNLNIKNEKKLDIDVELEDNTSKYVIEGNSNLNNKSIIKIIVTSSDNSIKTYTINIKNNDMIIKIIFISLITLLIIINIIRIIFKKINNKKITNVANEGRMLNNEKEKK